MVRTVDDKKNSAIESLSALSVAMNKKSEISKLREIIGYIELALSSGVRRKDVLETIRTSLDINMNLKTFEKNLYRIRKKQKTLNLKEKTKNDHKINTGSRESITCSDTKPETTSVAIPTQQNALAIIDEDEDNDEGVQTAFQPHDLKKVWGVAPNMAELRALGKELYKKQKEDAKNENNRN